MSVFVTIHDKQVSVKELINIKDNEKALDILVKYFGSVKDFAAYIPASDVTMLLSSTGLSLDDLMTSLLPFAAAYAVTPVSHFNVGTVAQGNSGALYFGSNIEFSDTFIATSVHGEQACTTNAYIGHTDIPIKRLAVNAAPCGHCRQFLSEYAEGLIVHVSNKPETTIANCLPDPFGPKDLGIAPFTAEKHNFKSVSIQGKVSQEVIDEAINGACISFAPYSNSESGVAVKCVNKDGVEKVFKGSYLEIAAYNPSLNPTEAALILTNLAGFDISCIKEWAIAERKGGFSSIPQAKVIMNALVPKATFAIIEIQ